MRPSAAQIPASSAIPACAATPDVAAMGVALQPLEMWLRPGPGPLLPQLRAGLAAQALRQMGPGAEALRWAITGVDPTRGLRLEAVLVTMVSGTSSGSA